MPLAPNQLTTACKLWVEREAAQGLKGQAADKACFEFMCGYAAALGQIDHPEADHVTGYLAMVIAVRGACEVRRIAANAR